jgi:SAM-dependent methyltransferase
MKNFLVQAHWLFKTQFGIDPLIFFRAIRGVIPYAIDYIRFSANYKGMLKLKPCLHDRYEEGGSAKDEYFWQDLFVAQKIYKKSPLIHVDIGSRIDGFVAHLATFRSVEVFDVRPITTQIPGVEFKQADLMNPVEGLFDYCDSLSSLHALEHFGLGRYGDPIDPKGYESGIRNMARIIKTGGYFYLSVPVGVERVEFNANRVFNPNAIVDIAGKNQLSLLEFYSFTAVDGLVEMDASRDALSSIGQREYSLGIFVFVKH